jgi:tRNA (guanine37-N1)-methyltransferase
MLLIIMLTHRGFDLLGNIAIVNFSKISTQKEKKKFASDILKKNPQLKTVLEKQGKIHGRLRKITTKYIAGEKTKEVVYRENGCVFRFNVDKTYFSPRLSNERKEIANLIKKNEDVLVMFSGVSPYAIVIGKLSKAKRVVSNEINREANKYSKLNIELNNLKGKVELAPGDIKRVARKFAKEKVKFDVIVMSRPNLKNSFLEEAFMLSKKGTRIFYYGFCAVSDAEAMVEMIKQKAKESKKKIKILGTKKAGEIAPFKIRLRVDLKVI